jgi:hypothetical protein
VKAVDACLAIHGIGGIINCCKQHLTAKLICDPRHRVLSLIGLVLG